MEAGLSKNIIAPGNIVTPSNGIIPAVTLVRFPAASPKPMAVESRIKRNCAVDDAFNPTKLTVAMASTVLVVLVGVIETDKLGMSVNVVLAIVNVSVLVVDFT